MSKPLHALSTLTESVKINSMRREEHKGRAYWVKRRRLSAAPILLGANFFFTAAKAPLRAILSAGSWQAWEVECFEGLHGREGFRAFADGAAGMGAEELPGTSLTGYLDTGRLTPPMAEAAGRELRRAHAWHSPWLRSLWSHGDAHAGNFVIEKAGEGWRARIIDFELRHLPEIPAMDRHADDLLGFLLDLVGRIGREQWLPNAEAFLMAYGNPELVAQLPALVLPGGAAPYSQMWRRVQTGFLARREYESRMRLLLNSRVFHPPGEPVKRTVAHVERAEFGFAQAKELVATTHSATAVPPRR